MVYKTEAGKYRRHHRRRSRSATRRASRCWWAPSPSKSRELLSKHAAKSSGIHAQCPERQVPRKGGRDRRPGRQVRRGHHRHQHGRPRHRHHARRQRRVPGQGRPAQDGLCRRADRRGHRLRRDRRPRRSSTPASVYARADAKYKDEIDDEADKVRAGRAACSSWAPSATSPAASTTSCAAAPAVRATRARRRFFLSLEDDLMRLFGSERVTEHDGDARAWTRTRPSTQRSSPAPIENAQKQRGEPQLPDPQDTCWSTTTS